MTLTPCWTARLAGLLAATAAIAPVAAQTSAALPGGANSLQETFENWTVACVLQDAAKRCALSQQQADQQSRQRVLAIELNAFSTDKVDGVLVLPFGLALDSGVTLQVDDAPAGPTLRFRTCLPVGCIVPLSFDARFVAALRKGAALKVNAFADGGKDAAFTVSLKGFPAALDRATALAK
ncbi:MAG: invasion associated locus B family protein [Roseiarcus sp.]|jgi:invasion protein IalB